MILFLYGPDTYRSGKKLKEIIARYKEVHTSGMSFHVLDPDADDFDSFRNRATSVSMFGEKRLVALKGLGASRDFAENFTSWNGKDDLARSTEVVCVFCEEQADKKNPFYVWLLKNAKSQEFSILSGMKLQKWAQEFVRQRDIRIEQGALARILAHTGGDLWAFENEMQKLKLYTRGVIGEKDLDVFLRPSPQTHIFSLVDAYIEGDRAKATKFLHGHLAAGDNEQYLFSMIQSQFRNVAQARDFLERGERDTSRIGRLCGMHPYVARKSLAQARVFDKARIKKIYSQLVDLDSSVKTGKLEPQAALENFILAL